MSIAFVFGVYLVTVASLRLNGVLEQNSSSSKVNEVNWMNKSDLNKIKSILNNVILQSRKDKDKPGSTLPVTNVNLPVPGKPELAVKPPLILGIQYPGPTDIEFVETPNIEIALAPVSKPIPIPSLPEIEISEGPSTLFQIPLLPHISFANPFPGLFGNFSLGDLKPWEFFSSKPEPPENKPIKPKPLYAKILGIIEKLQGKVIEVTGLDSLLPNSTTMQNHTNKAIGLIKFLMMDSPF